MEARAIKRFQPTSPRKARLVIDLIRGKSVNEAINILHFSPKHAARDAEKTLRSAVANLQTREDAGRVAVEDLFVKSVFVNNGPIAYRTLPAPQGRAYRMRKRSHHMTIVVATREGALHETETK